MLLAGPSSASAPSSASTTWFAGLSLSAILGAYLPDPVRLGRAAQLPAAVDHASAPVLVGEPRRGAVLAHAGLRVVADAAGEGLLKLRPLVVGEGDRVVVTP